MSRGIRGAAVLIPARQKKMVPTVGFELTTYRLQGGCSTPELCGQESKIQKYSTEFPILRPRKRPKMLERLVLLRGIEPPTY
jgi:hypothetical protein